MCKLTHKLQFDEYAITSVCDQVHMILRDEHAN